MHNISLFFMMESGLMFLGRTVFDKNVVFENKSAAVNFLKNKYKHLKNLEICALIRMEVQILKRYMIS